VIRLYFRHSVSGKKVRKKERKNKRPGPEGSSVRHVLVSRGKSRKTRNKQNERKNSTPDKWNSRGNLSFSHGLLNQNATERRPSGGGSYLAINWNPGLVTWKICIAHHSYGKCQYSGSALRSAGCQSTNIPRILGTPTTHYQFFQWILYFQTHIQRHNNTCQKVMVYKLWF